MQDLSKTENQAYAYEGQSYSEADGTLWWSNKQNKEITVNK